jgi:membrane protein YdbS with pleckstrin-like domain
MRHVAVQHLAQDPLTDAVTNFQIERQSPCELDDSMVKQRNAGFKPNRHASAINLCQDVVRQIGHEVEVHHRVREVRHAVWSPVVGDGGAALVLVVWLTIWPWMVWRTTHYVFTNERVVLQFGIFHRERRDIPLHRVNNHMMNQTLVDRMFGCGTLVIESAGSDGTTQLKDVPKVQRVQTLLYELVDADRDKHSLGDGQFREIMEDIKSGKIKATELIDPSASPIDKMKFNICQQIIKFKREHDYTNLELSEIIGVGPAVITRILHCQINRFKVDSLLNYYFSLVISSKDKRLIKKFHEELSDFLKNFAA